MNLLEALAQKNIKWRVSERKGEIYICCPFCTDRRFRFGLNTQLGHGHCFNCDRKFRGTAIIALQQHLRLGRWLQPTPVNMLKRPESEVVRLPEGFEKLGGGGNDHWTRRAYRYLRRRGVSRSQMVRFKIGFTETGRYSYRVVFPIYYRGRLEGFVTRAILPDVDPKYKNSVGDKAIWGLPRKRSERSETAVLLEGVLDAAACDRVSRTSGSRNFDALGILGHTLTGRQLDMLRGYRKFILWPDPDKAGVKGFTDMRHALRDLEARVFIVVPNFRDRRDPDEMPPKVRRRKIRQAVPLTDGLAQSLQLKAVSEEE